MNTIVTAVLLGSDRARQTFVAGAALVATLVGTGAVTTPPAGDSPSTALAEEATPGQGRARLATVPAIPVNNLSATGVVDRRAR